MVEHSNTPTRTLKMLLNATDRLCVQYSVVLSVEFGAIYFLVLLEIACGVELRLGPSVLEPLEPHED